MACSTMSTVARCHLRLRISFLLSTPRASTVPSTCVSFVLTDKLFNAVGSALVQPCLTSLSVFIVLIPSSRNIRLNRQKEQCFALCFRLPFSFWCACQILINRVTQVNIHIIEIIRYKSRPSPSHFFLSFFFCVYLEKLNRHANVGLSGNTNVLKAPDMIESASSITNGYLRVDRHTVKY